MKYAYIENEKIIFLSNYADNGYLEVPDDFKYPYFNKTTKTIKDAETPLLKMFFEGDISETELKNRLLIKLKDKYQSIFLETDFDFMMYEKNKNNSILTNDLKNEIETNYQKSLIVYQNAFIEYKNKKNEIQNKKINQLFDLIKEIDI